MLRYTLVFMAALCSVALIAQVENPDWQTLDKKSYSISFPDDWSIDNSGQMNTQFILTSAQEGPEDTFQESVSCISQDLGGFNMTLDQFAKLSEAQIPILIENGKVEDSKRVEGNDGMEYQRVVFTGSQEGINLKLIQHYYLYQEKAYVLTFNTVETEFENQKAIADKVLSTFRFK